MTLALNFLIPLTQLIGGIFAHSMALISDAAHNFSDFTAVFIAYIANRIGRRGASVHNTFGYRRAEILAALFNVALLLGVSVFIVYEGIYRLNHPEPVVARLVILVAGVGVVGNGLSALLLHRDAGHNLNVRGAFLHMLGDLFTSVVVVFNGIILIFKPWYWLDPLLSILIALFIVRNCWTILKEATCILMNATPSGLDILKIKSFLESVPHVRGVHDLHAWNVCSSSIAFSCHLVVPDQNLSEIDTLSGRIRHQLYLHFGIDHPMLQFETVACGDAGMLCGTSCFDSRSEEEPSPGVRKDWSAFFKKPLTSVLFWVRLVLGGIFIYASLDKIYHPAAFAQAIHNYQILPDYFINITAIVLPWIELVLGLLLLFGFWLPGAALLTNLLLITFFSAVVFNAARGLNVDCGCFGGSGGGDVSMIWYILRDLGFLVLSLTLLTLVFRKKPLEQAS
jgi:cation diffusion facilitator family transporter